MDENQARRVIEVEKCEDCPLNSSDAETGHTCNVTGSHIAYDALSGFPGDCAILDDVVLVQRKRGKPQSLGVPSFYGS